MIDKKGSFKFIFDTGGSNCITPELTKKLNLKLEARKDETGAGEKSVKAWSTKVADFSVNSITLKSQNFEVIEFAPIQKAFGFPEFDGIFGYEFLQKYVAQINYETSTTIFSEALPNTDEFQKISFDFLVDKLIIHAKINNLLAGA